MVLRPLPIEGSRHWRWHRKLSGAAPAATCRTSRGSGKNRATTGMGRPTTDSTLQSVVYLTIGATPAASVSHVCKEVLVIPLAPLRDAS
ncbi:MAG: hypothetical protein HYR55_05070 [Acidobacteria bacterium]|nr:hypothetical protein [Acidobacteriota bacterium]